MAMEIIPWALVDGLVVLLFVLLFKVALTDPGRPSSAPAPPRPTRKRVEDAGPVVLRKWSIEHRRQVAQDKHAWDRDFAQAQAAARLAPPGRGSTGSSTAAPVSGG
ncbi:MAG: hypothetical protein ACXVYB_00995 [Arthrobacter sp.]